MLAADRLAEVEEIQIDPLDLYGTADAYTDAVFNHQIGQCCTVNQNDALAQMAYEVHRRGAEG